MQAVNVHFWQYLKKDLHKICTIKIKYLDLKIKKNGLNPTKLLDLIDF
jgi:hypothetical protein